MVVTLINYSEGAGYKEIEEAVKRLKEGATVVAPFTLKRANELTIDESIGNQSRDLLFRLKDLAKELNVTLSLWPSGPSSESLFRMKEMSTKQGTARIWAPRKPSQSKREPSQWAEERAAFLLGRYRDKLPDIIIGDPLSLQGVEGLLFERGIKYNWLNSPEGLRIPIQKKIKEAIARMQKRGGADKSIKRVNESIERVNRRAMEKLQKSKTLFERNIRKQRPRKKP